MSQAVAPDRLKGRVSRISDVGVQDRRQMFELMTRYYDNVDANTFESDFESKTWVITAKSPRTGVFLDFSTQWFGDFVVDGSPVGILYSGDTIVDRKYWAKNPLATMWGRLALALIDRCPERELYWFLISKGYKTYRFLPVFFNEFYPSPKHPTPARYRLMIDRVAEQMFGPRYHSTRGVISATRDGCRLRRHVAGDELCCIAPLTRENLNQAAYRVIEAKAEIHGHVDIHLP